MLYGCSDTEHYVSREVDALYWHERNRYTAISIDEDGRAIKHRIPAANNLRVTLYTNLDADAKPWYECEWVFNFWTGADGSCEVYIHGLDEMGTADWNHGKFGSGSTTRLDK